MENEKVNQQEQTQPTYEQLAAAYNQLISDNQQMRARLQNINEDVMDKRLNTLLRILESPEKYSKKIIALAEYHVSQILAKPEKK